MLKSFFIFLIVLFSVGCNKHPKIKYFEKIYYPSKKGTITYKSNLENDEEVNRTIEKFCDKNGFRIIQVLEKNRYNKIVFECN